MISQLISQVSNAYFSFYLQNNTRNKMKYPDFGEFYHISVVAKDFLQLLCVAMWLPWQQVISDFNRDTTIHLNSITWDLIAVIIGS